LKELKGLAADMGTEEPASREDSKAAQWCGVSCPALCFLAIGTILIGLWWPWNPPPGYVLVIKDLLGYGFLFIGLFLGWKWVKQGR